MASKPIKVLIAPAHEALLDVGSEYHMVYDLICHLARDPDIQLDVLTGCVDPTWTFPQNVRVHTLLPYKPSLTLFDRIRLIWLCYRRAASLLGTTHYHLIHHIRPFKLHVTFSLLPLLGLTKGRPFLIGPIAAPQKVQFADDWLFLLGHTDSRTPLVKRLLGYLTVGCIRLAMWTVRGLSHATLRRTDVTVAASDDAKNEILRVVPGRRVEVIWGACLTIDPQPRTSYEAHDPFEILGIGYFVKRKNFITLIETFAEMAAHHPKIVLRLVGFGPEEGRLRRRTRELGVQDKIVFEGRVMHRDIAQYYRRADLFCSTSLSETDVAPSCLEAMASGLPVVVMDTAGFRPLVKPTETGVMVPQGDRINFVKGVLSLIGDRSLRERFGRQGFRHATTSYVWSVAAERYLKLYRELAHSS